MVVKAHRPCRPPQYKVIYFMGRYTISVLSWWSGLTGRAVHHSTKSFIPWGDTRYQCYHGGQGSPAVTYTTVQSFISRGDTRYQSYYHGGQGSPAVPYTTVQSHLFHGAIHDISVIMVVRAHRPCRTPQYIHPMGHDTCHSGQGSPVVTYVTVHSSHGDGTHIGVIAVAKAHRP